MAVGLAQDIHNMTKLNKSFKDQKVKKIIDLLKFALSTNDEEIIKSSIESVVEQLEEFIE